MRGRIDHELCLKIKKKLVLISCLILNSLSEVQEPSLFCVPLFSSGKKPSKVKELTERIENLEFDVKQVSQTLTTRLDKQSQGAVEQVREVWSRCEAEVI